METGSRNGIVDDTEDSDASLLIVNDDDEAVAGTSDDDANLMIPDAALSDGAAVNPAPETATELTCLVSAAATGSLPLSASSASGNATQDAVVVTLNDVNRSRHRRRHHRHHRSVLQPYL